MCTAASADAVVLVPRGTIHHGRSAKARGSGEGGPGSREVGLGDL